MYVTVYTDLPLDNAFTYHVPKEMEEKVIEGGRVEVPFGRQKKIGYVVGLSETYEGTYTIKDIKKVIDSEPVFTKEQVSMAHFLADFYLCHVGECLSMQVPGGRKDSKLELPSADSYALEEPIENLSIYQQTAVDTICAHPGEMYYLYGVTGSGKSEVYLRCAEKVIQEGKQVIYLVPEITLTHQLIKQVINRFKGKVAVLHSGLTASQRLKEWKKIIRGDVDFAIGVRSGIFAPFRNLGLVIIDEEHENSYKSGQAPRYHARQVAQWRCHKNKATLIMGSATPSLESWRLMGEGKVKKLDLPFRVSGGKMPQMEVVDLLGEKNILSERLVTAMRQTLQNHKQVILFLNRRGYSYFFHCKSCGYEMKCPHCSVSLTYHKEQNKMLCHYCGYSTAPITVCPECHSLDVGYSGFGTELVEKEVERLFPFAKIERLDQDTASKTKNNVGAILDRFAKRESDILLGTQMVAKGFNFPSVDLVGIVLADSGMNLPDFRAEERTFGLLTQVAGRAGRFSDDGHVIIQTFKPHNKAIQYAMHNMAPDFYEKELAVREQTGFPPYSRQINLVLRGKNEKAVECAIDALTDCAQTLADEILEKKGEEMEILGPTSCALAKLGGNYRFHLLLQAKNPALLHLWAKRLVEQYKIPSGMYMEVDIDPLSMM